LPDVEARPNLCLVLADADDRESAFLFGFALACARRLPRTLFVLRPHPAIPVATLRSRHAALLDLPDNVTLSAGRTLVQDFARARYLYRGSSAAVHAVLAGIKPFYVARAGEMSFDPLFAVKGWRETVSSPEELAAALKDPVADGPVSNGPVSNDGAWENARDECNRVVSPVRPEALEELLAMAGSSAGP
jgi:hypothetical protein